MECRRTFFIFYVPERERRENAGVPALRNFAGSRGLAVSYTHLWTQVVEEVTMVCHGEETLRAYQEAYQEYLAAESEK